VRPDLADVELADRVFAPHYAEAQTHRVLAATLLTTSPKADSAPLASLEPGAQFSVLDISGAWAWGRCAKSGLVGYVPCSAITLA